MCTLCLDSVTVLIVIICSNFTNIDGCIPHNCYRVLLPMSFEFVPWNFFRVQWKSKSGMELSLGCRVAASLIFVFSLLSSRNWLVSHLVWRWIRQATCSFSKEVTISVISLPNTVSGLTGVHHERKEIVAATRPIASGVKTGTASFYEIH